jgi:CDP-glucose 4,6-dehydratase
MMMSNILVTGANGFVGAALCERLLRMNKTVVGLIRDRNYKSRRDILDNISVVYGDLRDYDVVRYAVSKYEIDTIFHLGAITILRMATYDPKTCFQTNIMGTVNVLEAARECGHVSKVVVASSDKAYGNHVVLPYKEDFALLASDPYSTSKSCTDLLTQSYAYNYDLNTSILRSGNIFGPGDLNKSRIIPGSILRILDGERPVIYSGVGNFKREFMYIDDVIDGYMSVQDRGLKGEAYNIGGSGFQNIFDTVGMIIEEMGVDIEPQILERDFIEIKEQYLDASKLESLGWKCNFNIREGIRASIPWYKQYHDKPQQFYWAH